CSESVLREENEVAHLRERLAGLEHEISETQRHGLELKSQTDRHESRIQFNEERLLEIQKLRGNALNDISQAEERRRAAEEELAAVSDRLAASTRSLEQHRNASQAKQDTLRSLEGQSSRQQDALRRAQSDAFAVAQQLTRIRNEMNALDLQ